MLSEDKKIENKTFIHPVKKHWSSTWISKQFCPKAT